MNKGFDDKLIEKAREAIEASRKPGVWGDTTNIDDFLEHIGDTLVPEAELQSGVKRLLAIMRACPLPHTPPGMDKDSIKFGWRGALEMLVLTLRLEATSAKNWAEANRMETETDETTETGEAESP